jgi:hypothetical protein
MPLTTVINKFNRGEIGSESIARDDIDRVRNSAALMTNFLPTRLGPMVYRPGLQWRLTEDGYTYTVPFVKGINDKAILLFSDGELRIVVNDAIVTRTTVASTITNPNFTSNITGWTVADGVGSSSVWAAGYASLTGAGSTSANIYQTITTTAVPHAVRIVIAEAPARIRIGTSGVSSSNIFDGTLDPGTHSILFTPASNPTITVTNSDNIRTLIGSIDFETTGDFILPTTITAADLPYIRYHQSADVVFIAVRDQAPIKVERRGTYSWGIADYRANNGPFGTINITEVSLTAAALSGNTTLTASAALFKSTDVGALYKLTSAGQNVAVEVNAQDNGTGSIRVTGVTGSRIFTINISGTFVATVTLQRSADNTIWEDLSPTYSGVTSTTYDDGFDNSILYYRLWVKTGSFTSGPVVLSMNYSSGAITGIARVTAYTSSTVVSVQVLEDFGATVATRDWYKGQWNATDGYPSALCIYEGRLFFSGSNHIWGSESDSYYSFDDTVTGGSAPISRTIGIGPVDDINWICPTSRLLIGLPNEDLLMRSNAFGEVMTNDNANIKDNSGQGSSICDFVKSGQAVYFVHHTTTKLIRLFYDVQLDAHESEDLMVMHPQIASVGIKRMAVSRQPENRLWLILEDGDCLVLLNDLTEQVTAWARLETDGSFDDVVVLPGTSEDQVYFSINRNGTYHLEKLTMFSESHPHDSHVRYTSPGTTLTGLTHLNGETIGVWADGADLGDYVVSGGSVTIAAGKTNVTAGLRYTADYQSNKIAEYTEYSVLTRRARIENVAFIASNLYGPGLSVGLDSANLRVIEGYDGASYDQDSFPFNGSYDTNSRVWIRATAPCMIKAVVYGVRESESKTNN